VKFAMIPLDKIRIPPLQTREKFNEEALKNLADSMEEVGQLQPVIVVPAPESITAEGDSRTESGDEQEKIYELIAGERRFRARQKMKQADTIAALILDEDLPPDKLYEINLVENLQRQDLNELERARGIKKYIEEHGLNKSEASKKLGIPRTTLTEWLQILEIKPEFQQAVLDEDCALSLSHVNLALNLGSSTCNPMLTRELIEAVIKYNLTRREVKKITRLYQRHLHLEMEEALGVVLLNRERQKSAADLGDLLEEEKRKKPVQSLLNKFSSLAEQLEEFMEEIAHLEPEEEKALKDEFLYIYQLMKLLVEDLD